MPKRSRKEQRIAAALSSYVKDKYHAAYEAMSDHYDDMELCLSLLRGASASSGNDPDAVDLNIVAPVAQGVVAMMQDVLGSVTDKPYALRPSPIAELPDAVHDRMVSNVQRHLMQLIQLTGGNTERIQGAIGQMRETLLETESKKAEDRAQSMERLIDDRMKEANWTEAFLDFITNFVQYPVAVMKAPVISVKKTKHWVGDRLVYRDTVVHTVENISPFDFVPAPNSADPQTAEYVCERRRITATALIDLGMVDGYNVEAIDRVLLAYPRGYLERYSDGGEENPESIDGETTLDPPDCRGEFDTIGFYGRIPGEYLVEFGVDLDDERNWYEAEVWCVADEVIFAQLNPDPQGKRPFYTGSMYPTPGAIHGSCVPLRLCDTQRVCTAAARALIRNMAYSSGITGEVDPEKLADDEDPRIVLPNQLRLVKGAYNGGDVIRYHKVPSNAGELMGVFDQFLGLAYELIGIPRIAFGSPNSLGAIGRTSGGVSMLMNQAAKPIRLAMRHIERSIVEPVIQHFVDDENMFGNNPAVKGDVEVYAKGLSGVEERAQETDKLTWALQSIASLPPGVVQPTAVTRLLFYIFESYGIPTEGILPDYDMQDALSSDIAGASMTELQGQTGSATARVPLDGRSANAKQAIAVMNGTPGGPGAPAG